MFEIDDEMLSFADDFEGHPEVYERDKMKVIINQPANESTSQPATSSESRSKHKGAADGGPEASRQACGRAKVKEELAEGECVYAGDTLEVWAYFLKHVSPAMLELPCIEEYSSSGPNFKEYDAEWVITVHNYVKQKWVFRWALVPQWYVGTVSKLVWASFSCFV